MLQSNFTNTTPKKEQLFTIHDTMEIILKRNLVCVFFLITLK